MFHDPGRYRFPDEGPHEDPGPRPRRHARDPGPERFADERGYDWDYRYDRPPEDRSFERREGFVPAWADDEDAGAGPPPRGRHDGRHDGWDMGRTDRRYSLDDTRRRLPREETERLIASDKVEGTPVYDPRGRRLGEVANFMVDKRSGQVAYAVVRVRGGLMHGQAWRPVDWDELVYDERVDGYRLDLDRRALRRERERDAWR